jgi:hypothetical protein
MKPTYQIQPLSGPASYTPLNITGTTPATANVLHTSSSTDIDELWVETYNYSTDDAVLSVAIGGTASYQTYSQIIPPGRGLVPLIRGIKLGGGTVVKAYASAANKVSIVGYVHRIIFI